MDTLVCSKRMCLKSCQRNVLYVVAPSLSNLESITCDRLTQATSDSRLIIMLLPSGVAPFTVTVTKRV
jgi:hypothetical protein